MAEQILVLRVLLALLLYAFLGVGLYVLWRGLRQGEIEQPPAPPVARLRVETGPDTGKQTSVHAVTAIGRAADNNLVLQDLFASAYHVLIFWREQQWWLEDLESHNGTLLTRFPGKILSLAVHRRHGSSHPGAASATPIASRTARRG